MGQSPVFPANGETNITRWPFANAVPRISVFQTDLGWFGLVGAEQTTFALTIGHASKGEVRDALSRLPIFEAGSLTPDLDCDWNPQLRKRLQMYCEGTREDFGDFPVVTIGRGRFKQRVLAEARKIEYGQVLSYGELAAKCGSPRAARAVGQAMATNPIPILIPCHRVIGARGRLGGFSAPGGTNVKERMLEMEGVHLSGLSAQVRECIS